MSEDHSAHHEAHFDGQPDGHHDGHHDGRPAAGGDAGNTVSDLRCVKSIMGIPLVTDSLSLVSSLHQQASGYTMYSKVCSQGSELMQKTLSQMWGGVQSLQEIQSKVQDRLPDRVAQAGNRIGRSVRSTVATGINKLDGLAASGLDSLKNKVPVLTTPTGELVSSARSAASSLASDAAAGAGRHLRSATDYLASFALAQLCLDTASNALGMGESVLSRLEPVEGDEPNFITAKIIPYSKPFRYRMSSVRGHVTTVLEAGLKRRGHAAVTWSSLAGDIQGYVKLVEGRLSGSKAEKEL